MANLLEAYKNRLVVANRTHEATHSGEKLSENKKLMIAKCLENTNKLLSEAFDSSIGTQRGDLGAYKKFCMNLLTVALPSLIAPDLVITYPMSSISGYLTYIEYVSGTAKGDLDEDTLFNNPFQFGDTNKARTEYTSSKVTISEVKTTSATGSLKWTPVIPESVEFIVDGATSVVDGGDGNLYTGRVVKKEVLSNGNVVTTVVTAGTAAGTIDYATGAYTLTTAPETSIAVNYTYDNIVVPQAAIPTLKARLKAIPLAAKARRIAIFYSQIAAFQAKTDYGMDLAGQLAEKAVGELQYEIDTEVVNLLTDNAESDDKLKFNKRVPLGISKADHYEAFTETVSIAKQIIYDRTKRFAPNYMIVASDVINLLGFLKGWKAAPASSFNGPYFAGTLEGLKVYVSPAIAPGKFVFGVNGNDMMNSAAVYAPYMPIVPTQLLGFADGGQSQGFSTMYDLKILNKSLLVSGSIVDEAYPVDVNVTNPTA